MNPAAPAERVLHFLTLFFLGSLIATYGLQRLALEAEPFWPGGLGWFLLQTAPLLGCLPALLRGNRAGTLLLSMAAIIYFALGIWTLIDPGQRLAGIAEVGFSLGLFLATVGFLSAQGQRLQREADADASGLDDLPEQDS
ncbi:MAG: DUF2069 domain-containing protein [Gammaproteobacteria bacterium]|nr:MAG: DUF2069 domain-containing protein [Gammaproteobacteria bacterium]